MPNPDGGGNPGAEVAASIVAAAKLTAARLVAQGESELMLARADAARIQAAARLQLAQAMASGRAFPDGESSPTDQDVAFQLTEEARRQAAEIVANARIDARRILEEAKLLLQSSRQQAGLQPVEPDVVVDDRDTGTRGESIHAAREPGHPEVTRSHPSLA